MIRVIFNAYFHFLTKILIAFTLFVSLHSYGDSIEFAVSHSAERLILPVPQETMHSLAFFELKEGQRVIPSKFSRLVYWPLVSGPSVSSGVNEEPRYIRFLFIDLNGFKPVSSHLTLHWGNTASARKTQSNIVDKRKGLISKSGDEQAELVYPSTSWLAQAILLHPPYSQQENIWYVEPQKKYANYVTNTQLLAKNGYVPEKTSQWLYDRPQAIYQLFIMSGEKQWLVKANSLVGFYQSHIDEDGNFTLKKHFDPKLLMPKGLLYNYLLNGDVEALEKLKNIYYASLDWNANYKTGRGFWTERNQAAALNTAVSYWEVSNDEAALVRINNIIDATVEMTFNPQGDWSLRGCPQHSFKSHEGWGDNSPACSPWMMALLGDALWRFYLLTEDKRAAALLDAFGDFILNLGVFYGDKRVKNIIIPKYIVSIENADQEKLNQWTDPQHTCDVAGLIGKSVYIKDKAGGDNFFIKALFNALLEQCQSSYVRLKHQQKKKNYQTHWVLKPPRRFAWMYSTTSDLPWLNSLLNSRTYIRE